MGVRFLSFDAVAHRAEKPARREMTRVLRSREGETTFVSLWVRGAVSRRASKHFQPREEQRSPDAI